MEGPTVPTPPVSPSTPQKQPEIITPSPQTVDGSSTPAASATASLSQRFAGAKTLLSILLFIGSTIITATLINQFIFQSYYVDGTSMTPTLRDNDRLIIDKVERTFATAGGKHYIPARGQIVVLDSSLVDQSGRSEQLVKRVIGLPGDTVNITGNGTVTIKNSQNPSGFNVNESLGLSLEPTYVDSPVSITIPENQVFVMGDNRGPGGSFDSRSFGPIDTSKIQGRLLARIFPFNATGFF